MSWALPPGAVLGLFGKRPVAGLVKTRLAQAMGPLFAAQAAEAMLFDALDLWAAETTLAPGGRRVLVYDPPDAGLWFDARTPAAFALQPQAAGDLGARMAAFFAGEFEDGATQVVLLGSDSPTLDLHFVVAAFLLLEHKDVVVGPSADGGYYLLGCRRLVPELFQGVDWSTPTVLAQTVNRVNEAGCTLGLLPLWYDVDDGPGWQTLMGHVCAMRAAGMPVYAPRVERLMVSLHPGWDCSAAG